MSIARSVGFSDVLVTRAETNWQRTSSHAKTTSPTTTSAIRLRPLSRCTQTSAAKHSFGILGTVLGGFDGRSHVKIVLDALEAVIQNKATKDHLKVTIGTRTIEQMSPQDIETWRAQYQAEYARELQAERTAKGLGSPRTIKARIR